MHPDPAPAVPLGDADISRAAALFADPSRARILRVLADGRSAAAGILAAEAGISAQAASAQLNRLRQAGFVEVERSGRHRLYRLSSPRIARAMEALAALAPAGEVRSLRESTRAAALRAARTCYDHLAGRLGVDLTAALLARDALTVAEPAASTAELGPAAVPVLTALGAGATVPALAAERARVRLCLDWSEQRPHLAGRLGAALLTAMTTAGWLERRPRQRAVRLTAVGSTALTDVLGPSPSWAGDSGS